MMLRAKGLSRISKGRLKADEEIFSKGSDSSDDICVSRCRIFFMDSEPQPAAGRTAGLYGDSGKRISSHVYGNVWGKDELSSWIFPGYAGSCHAGYADDFAGRSIQRIPKTVSHKVKCKHNNADNQSRNKHLVGTNS